MDSQLSILKKLQDIIQKGSCVFVCDLTLMYPCLYFLKNEDYTCAQKIKIPLPSGSLLIMKGSTQADWQVITGSFELYKMGNLLIMIISQLD